MTAPPHGGTLVDGILKGDEREAARERARGLPAIDLAERQAREAENLAMGVYSPLAGFMKRVDFESVLAAGRLAGGVPFTIPVVLDVSEDDLARIAERQEAALRFDRRLLAILRIEEAYRYDRVEMARRVFGTEDAAHPGVALTLAMQPVLLAGAVDLVEPAPTPFPRHRLSPRDTRALFESRGWRTVVGFQTRNLPHVGHEALQKAALNLVDGLFVNPLVGGKKAGDFEDPVIVAAYEALLAHYYPAERAALGVLQGQMRYAGPREAVFHAIQRKNFGCTHFIVGRDHAGVGTYYPPYAAQEIFQDYPDLGITPLFFPAFFRCRRCGGPANEKICPHPGAGRIDFSGTRLRDALLRGEGAEEMIRPEVMEAIRAAAGGPFRD
jgi:sulfate adenylyltransferase